MTESVTFSSLHPYLRCIDADAEAAWLKRVLGFEIGRSVPDDQGRWTEGEIHAGPALVNLSGPAAPGERTGGLLMIVTVDDVDAQYRRIRDAGETIDPPKDEDYGPRTCHVVDPEGYDWYFWQGEAVYPT